jgi:hypothetical protein
MPFKSTAQMHWMYAKHPKMAKLWASHTKNISSLPKKVRGNMSQRMRSDAQLITHDNYATSTSPATKTLPSHTSFILIENMDSTDSVLVSFDSGVSFKTLGPGKALSLDCDSMKSYDVKSSAGTPAVEALYGSEK